MTGFLLAAAFAAAQPAPAPAAAPELPYSVTFARTRFGPWKIEAETIVERTTGRPLIDYTRCEIERGGLKLTVWPQGGAWFSLEGYSREADLHFSQNDIRRIALDDDVWEMRWVEVPDSAMRFVDVAYPPVPPPEPCHMCARSSSGFWTSRRRPGDPAFHPQLLADRLIRARVLRIGFEGEVEEAEAPGPILWVEVPLAGLDGALAWCGEAMASDRARRFHGGIPR